MLAEQRNEVVTVIRDVRKDKTLMRFVTITKNVSYLKKKELSQRSFVIKKNLIYIRFHS